MGVGKIDRDEISVSFPYQDESIYSYKNFFKKLKNAGFTKIRLLGNKKQFSKEVYKKLQITKFSAKQMESWESTKYECNRCHIKKYNYQSAQAQFLKCTISI